MNLPSIAQIQSIDNICDNDILPTIVNTLIECSPGETYDQQLKNAADLHPSVRTLQWYVLDTFIGMWENGGMQHVLLCEDDEVEHKQWELKKVIESCRIYECHKIADFIQQLLPKSEEWSRAITQLNQRENKGEDIGEHLFDEIWSQVDVLDSPFEELLETDNDIYDAMARDVQKHPELYLPSI
ncbi:hypothetical protein ACFPK9_00695 [Rubritalea spongiae]|uniref:DUF4375 domain-containing protein n=1 Tax=Rubritalea spongiae TaxID=430797 RepID=A0ABW5E8M4_9BACT